MAKLGKRGYPALYLKGSNAWYTGYAHDWKMEDKVDVMFPIVMKFAS